MDKRIAIPTALVVATFITAETLQPHHKPNPHVDPPAVGAPVTPGPPPATGFEINQIS
jgi:hypothetical protein